MRKVLAGFLATAMVASIGATMTYAASKPAVDVDTVAGAASSNLPTDKDAVQVVLKAEGKTYTASIKKTPYAADRTKTLVAEDLIGTVIPNVEIDGRRFDVKITAGSAAGKILVTLDAPYEIPAGTNLTLDIQNAAGETLLTGNIAITFATGSNGEGNRTVDYSDSVTLNPEDVFECGTDGNPLPLTETNNGVDKDQNDQGGVQSGTTVYFMIKDNTLRLEDENYWKMRVNKGSNGKYVKAISDVTKNFSGNLVSIYNNRTVPGTSGRHRFIKVEMNELFTDDEYKIVLDVTMTPKSKAVDNKTISDQGITDNTQLKIKDFYFYMKNMVKSADNDWKVGISGLMLDPLSNDWNEVTYFDEDGDLAFMKFFADSDVSKFYAKLSTKWEHADYASYFNDQDAYIFDFTGSPKISATSRCDLQIYNPFVDEDGNETIDPATATVYQVIDGDLFDVTDSFKYEEGDNGDMAFTTRTRFLGTYIICEKPVEEAADSSTETPADLVPEDTAPEAVTPDSNNGGKAPANTGKFA